MNSCSIIANKAFNLAINMSRATQGHQFNHSWAKVSKTVHEIIWISLFPSLPLPYKRSKSTQAHYMNNLSNTLEYPMPHTIYQCHWLIGSGEDLRVFWSYLDMKAMLVMWPRLFEQIIVFSAPEDYDKIWLQSAQWRVRIELFEIIVLWEAKIKGQIMTLTILYS